MGIKALILITILLIVNCASANERKNLEDKYKCAEDSDCVLVEFHCGEPISINKHFVKEHAGNMEKYKDLVMCGGIKAGSWADGFKSKCVGAKCVVLYPNNWQIVSNSKSSGIPVVSLPPHGSWDTSLQNFRNVNPVLAAENNYKVGKYHLLGVQGYAVTIPGVDPAKMRIVDGISRDGKYSVVVIEGTSDVIQSEEHRRFISVVKEFASKYNKQMLKLLTDLKPTSGEIGELE